MQLGFVTGASHDRFWFLRPDGDELIQFQQDRLLHNWRKVGDLTNEYPRFESMIERFQSELEQLDAYVNTLSPQHLSINQCELSYINHIVPSNDQALNASDWLRFISFKDLEPESFSCSFREIIRDESGKPQGRLICETTTGIKPDGNKLIALTLTARGAPDGTDIASAVKFLAKGRELIVCKFAELTTDTAREKWGQVK
jgi:uncharacterized protein (TIGR04255 family)